ncbi:MAG: hypothetical protein Q9201_003222 [Fulgogasparrea decipioides]
MSRKLKKIQLYYDDFLAIAAWTSALALAKLSVLVQLYRIFITVTFRRSVLFLGAIIICWWISSVFAYGFMCSPVRWNGTPKVLNWIAPVPWIVTDFAILLAPLPMIHNLQLSMPNKIGLCALFLTGGFTCIVACIHFSKILEIDDDVTWSTTQASIWSVIETNVTVICACLVVIRPALRYLMPDSLLSFVSELGQGSQEHSTRLRNKYPHRLAAINLATFKAESGLHEHFEVESMEEHVLAHKETSQKEVV